MKFVVEYKTKKKSLWLTIFGKTPWTFYNSSLDIFDSSRYVKIYPGEYEVEIIPNPHDAYKDDWMVFKGTKIGCAVFTPDYSGLLQLEYR